MALDVEQLQNVENVLADNMIADWAVPSWVRDAGMPELAKFLDKLLKQ